jgi:hypothetical protein
MVYNVTGGTYDGGSINAPSVEIGSTIRLPIQKEVDNLSMSDVTDISYYVEVYKHDDIGDLKFLHYA